MTRRAATTGLAWALFGFFVLTLVATLALIAWSSAATDQLFVFTAFGFGLVGALVAAREPGNAVGWLLLAAAVSFGLQELAVAYLAEPGRPGDGVAVWFDAQLGWLFVALVLLPLLFPNGRLLSPRWRVAVWVGLAGFVLDTVGVVLEQDAVLSLGNLLLAVALLLAAASLVLRLRRSQGRERQQVKLFVYVGALAVTVLLFGMPTVFIGPSAPDWVVVMGTIAWFTTLALILFGMPIAIGVAILRHRLYDIDVVIKRTLVYGSLTILLGASYLGSVLLLQLALNPLTQTSDLAVAASTFAVAALFRPVRKRVQAVVDQRFYRGRYDAARTLAGFSARLRDELDLEALGADLRDVVGDTMQPVHVSLWLRETRT
ncbi:MAG TPA: hypothetical protein VFD59_14070 [Nocardioidaceae bacterium]|nr:hypothetical protein [Nocardioidaceae bacterium]